MNPNKARRAGAMEPELDEQECAQCGLEKIFWSDNSGEGYAKGKTIYCCEGCAEGTGCLCERETESVDIARIEEESGDRSKRSRR